MNPVVAEPNPAWINRVLSHSWVALEKRVGRELMPIELEGSGQRKRYVQEYGCGSYGCVMPTSAPKIVVKVTTDVLEAHFVAAALQINEFPAGIVRYVGILRLPAEHRNRPVFVLWREEAHDVGSVGHHSFEKPPSWIAELDDYDKRNVKQFKTRLLRLKTWAHAFKESFDRAEDKERLYAELPKWHSWAMNRVELDDVEADTYRPLPYQYRGSQRLAVALRGCEVIAEMMANEPFGDLVGGALEFYMEHGLLLADVHTGNIGRVDRPDYGGQALVITDPGHALPLDTRFATVAIDSLVQT